MSARPPDLHLACAIIEGWPAAWLAEHMRRALRDDLDELPAPQRQRLEGTIASVEYAGLLFSSRRNPVGHGGEIAGASEHDQRIDTKAAAAMLNLCPRRVQQLAAAGTLTGTREAGRWTFAREAIDDYEESRECAKNS